MTVHFKHGHSDLPQWQDALSACVAQLGDISPTANLGFIYVSDRMVEHLPAILASLKLMTRVEHWVGTTGIGICSTNQEYLDRAALSLMVGEFPANSFRIIPSIHSLEEIPEMIRVGELAAHFGIVHIDPRNHQAVEIVRKFAEKMSSGFVVGGVTSSRRQYSQVANEVCSGGLSGVVFTDQVVVATRLTQGVSPLGKTYVVTDCDRNVISMLDGRPALDVLREEIGELLFRDLDRLSEYIFIGLPIPGSDTGDYLVRNLIGLDLGEKQLAVAAQMHPGMQLMFCRRDGNTAVEDMQRMLDDLNGNLSARPSGALYFSCLGRGESLFGPESEELRMISRVLGDIPLAGFFANGEISHNRLYGYTGVLTLFR